MTIILKLLHWTFFLLQSLFIFLPVLTDGGGAPSFDGRLKMLSVLSVIRTHNTERESVCV